MQAADKLLSQLFAIQSSRQGVGFVIPDGKARKCSRRAATISLVGSRLPRPRRLARPRTSPFHKGHVS